MTLLSELGDFPPVAAAPAVEEAPRRRSRWPWLLLGLVLAVALSGAGIWAMSANRTPPVSAAILRQAIDAAATNGEGPGMNPICVTNGLDYGEAPINVQAADEKSASWMEVLVRAGLYGHAEPESANAVAASNGAAVRVYMPEPGLRAWSGNRRLCVARAIRLADVRNVGRVESMRFRGESYQGVQADVIWALSDPAPWLATPEVAQAVAAQLPAWRGARWTITPQGWSLTQHRHFFLREGRWLTSEALEREADLPPRPEPPR